MYGGLLAYWHIGILAYWHIGILAYQATHFLEQFRWKDGLGHLNLMVFHLHHGFSAQDLQQQGHALFRHALNQALKGA